MKTSNLMLLGAAGIAAYLIFSRRTTASDNFSGESSGTSWGNTDTYPVMPSVLSPVPVTASTNFGVSAAASMFITAMNQGRISSNTTLADDWTPLTATSLQNIGTVLNLNPANPNLFSDSVLKKISAGVNRSSSGTAVVGGRNRGKSWLKAHGY